MEQIPRVLIVDDDPVMANSVQAILQDRGYDLKVLNNPLKALAQINQGNYDLVLLDVMMPQMTGFELLEAYDRENVETLFIIMTGDASMESAVEAIRKGASDYLKKPFDPDELIIRVKNLARQIQLNQHRIQAEKDKHHLETQLSQSRKMEAIGTLAGGIAHDFNNILGIIMGNTELVIEDMSPLDPSRQNLEKVITAGNRAKEVINQLLSFSRKTDCEQKPIKLNDIILDSLKLLRASIPTNIEIRHDISKRAHTVLGDTTQIHQIMINLCTNAAHAMQEKGGVLTVSLKSVAIENDHLFANSELEDGDYIQLVVADTGHGIAEDVRAHIFDPYFTTKDPGKGTGMGLSVVHGIVKNHGGDIQVYSEVGVKTEFHILLPVVDCRETASESVPVAEMSKGTEHILLVDDEEMIVDMMMQMLRQLGYRVTGYTRSTDALEAFRKTPDAYDLVITDMTMPHLKGDRLAADVKDIRVGIPVILCTGFSEGSNGSTAAHPAIDRYLMKPVAMIQLAEAVRAAIDRSQHERRKDTRYGLNNKTFVISNADPRKRAKLIDISRSGFSFQYDEGHDLPGQFEELSIKTMDNRFSLDNITYETISDIEAGQDTEELTGAVRRRGGKFSGLTPFQNEQLAHYIRDISVDMRN